MINEECPCKRQQCPRHGDCVTCREHHLSNKKIPTYCEQIKDKEKREAKQAQRRS